MKNRRYWNRFVFSYLFGSCSALWKSLGLIRVKSPQFPRAASQQVPGTNAKRECFVQYFPFETRSILPAHHGCLTVPTHLVRHKHRNFCQIWRATIAEYFQNLGCQDQEKQQILPKFFLVHPKFTSSCCTFCSSKFWKTTRKNEAKVWNQIKLYKPQMCQVHPKFMSSLFTPNGPHFSFILPAPTKHLGPGARKWRTLDRSPWPVAGQRLWGFHCQTYKSCLIGTSMGSYGMI